MLEYQAISFVIPVVYRALAFLLLSADDDQHEINWDGDCRDEERHRRRLGPVAFRSDAVGGVACGRLLFARRMWDRHGAGKQQADEDETRNGFLFGWGHESKHIPSRTLHVISISKGIVLRVKHSIIPSRVR